MLVDDILLESPKTWYHGSPQKFDTFDVAAPTVNRATRVSGIYLTSDIKEARHYAGEDGFIYTVRANVSNSAEEHLSNVSDDMVAEYVRLLVDKGVYNQRWAETAIGPEFKERGVMKGDVSGDLKRQVLMSGGYDSYYFNDMGDWVLVVFDPRDITILDRKSVK